MLFVLNIDCAFQPRTTRLNHQTLKLLKYWTWQFVIIRPVCSLLMITLQLLGIYPRWVSWTFSIILNMSFFLAMYSLLAFYHVFAKELTPHKPLATFICITGMVLFRFWQYCISVLPSQIDESLKMLGDKYKGCVFFDAVESLWKENLFDIVGKI